MVVDITKEQIQEFAGMILRFLIDAIFFVVVATAMFIVKVR